MAGVTVQDALQTAIQHHRSGQLGQAEQIYRQILAQQPNHPDALHLLGLIAQQVGRIDIAADLIRQSIAHNPNSAEAHSNLGNILRAKGQVHEAMAAYRRAVALKPDFADAHNNLGNALKDNGQIDEAISAYRQAIARKPNFPEAYNNLANALMDKGQLDEAIAACRQAIALKPDFPEAYNLFGNALKDKGQLDQSIAAFRQAVALKSDFPEACNNLGNALMDKGRLDEAIASFRQAIALRSDYAEAYSNLGNALNGNGQIDEAITIFRRGICLNPRLPGAHSNLANALMDKGQLDEAIAACRQAIALDPKLSEAYNSLGSMMKSAGQLTEAIAAFRQAIALKSIYLEAHSNLLLTLHYDPDNDVRRISQENRLWNRQYAEPLKQYIQPHANDRSPERKLRIGYVSPDLREHSVGRFLLPLLANHDKSQVEVFAYAQVLVPDAMTGRLRSHADAWRSIVGLSDAQAADLIRQDQIDILIDLAMHTANNRLLVFARKPAPVQATYLAYCSTTGLETIDYRLSDPCLDPPGQDESCYSERTIRLPESYWCYEPTLPTPEVGPLPAAAAGSITFGCLNNFCKVSEPVLAAWAALLREMPNSRLLLHAHEGSHRERLQQRLQREGIEPTRVRFAGMKPVREYFDLYSQIDIALDTFPYCGGTTTCDALWMGVPVVSLIGKTAVGRAGLSILSNIGLPELVARSEDEYVRIATELASDLPRLSELRSTLRQRMQQSPLMDAPRFARNVEAAYRQMWRNWCAELPAAR
jgi:predicted O-linked N-acetylglucosamine transferase (SPINDLY family)